MLLCSDDAEMKMSFAKPDGFNTLYDLTMSMSSNRLSFSKSYSSIKTEDQQYSDGPN